MATMEKKNYLNGDSGGVCRATNRARVCGKKDSPWERVQVRLYIQWFFNPV
jgi:hypothetical protein